MTNNRLGQSHALLLMSFVIFFLSSCSKEQSDENSIIDFYFPNQTCDVVIGGTNVKINVYKYIDVSKLTPIVTVSEWATVDPPSGSPVDFTNPATYTVTAQDGSVATYVVTVDKNLSRKNDIESFQFAGTEQIFEREGDNLFVYVPYETDITNIKANVAVSDMATVNPANGTVMDFTTSQIYTVTASDGTSKNYLITVKKSPWRNVIKNGEAPFLKVDGHQLVVFKDKMWLLGGWLGKYDNDKATYHAGGDYWVSQVWCTSDGVNWESKGNAPWSGRHGFGCVVFNNKIWVIGGDEHTDVWNSEDGITWNKVLDVVPWGKRYFPYIVNFKGKIWVMGGQNISSGQYFDKYNDVWSTVDGVNWTREVEFVKFVPRCLISGTAILNEELFILGGSSLYSYSYNDVWKTADGVNWTQVAPHAEWSPRQWHSVASFDNKLWVIGGDYEIYGNSMLNDVWYSSNGKNWTQQKGVFFEPRHASPVIEFKNRLWMVGGLISRTTWGDTSNDVWVMNLNE